MNTQKIKNAVKKTAKYTGMFAGGLLFLVFFVFVCLRFEFAEQAVKRYALNILNPVLSAYNLQAEVEDLDLNLPFSVRVRNVRLSDGGGEFLTLESLNVDSRFWALLRYRVVIPSIEFNALSLQRLPKLTFPEKQEEENPLPLKEQFDLLHGILFQKYMPSIYISNISFKNARISPALLNALKKQTNADRLFFDEPIMLNGSWTAGLEKEMLRFSGKISAGFQERTAVLEKQLDVSADKVIRFSVDFQDDKGLLAELAKKMADFSKNEAVQSAEPQNGFAEFSVKAAGTLEDFELNGNASVFDGDFLKDTAAAELYYSSKPFKGNFVLQAKPVFPALFKHADIDAKIDLDTFSISSEGRRLEENAYTAVDEAIKNKQEIPNKNLGFHYKIQFNDMDYANPRLKELLGDRQEISGKLDLQFFTRQLPKIMAKDVHFLAKNISYKTNVDISRDVNVSSEFTIKSFSFLDTPKQSVQGNLNGKLAIKGRLEDPKITLTADMPQFFAKLYDSEQDKADRVNEREYKLENLKFELKSQGFEKPEDVIPLDREAMIALYQKHPYAAAVKRMQELYQSAVNYPVKLLLSFQADYMDEHSFVNSQIRLSPKVLGLGEGKKKFFEIKSLKGNVFGAGFDGSLRVDMPLNEDEEYRLQGKITGSMPDAKALENAFFLPLQLTDLTYGLEFKHGGGKGQQVLWQAHAQKGSYNLYEWQDFDARIRLENLWKNGGTDSSVTFKSLEIEDIGMVTDYRLTLKGPFSKMLLKSSFDGDARFDIEAGLSSNFEQVSGELTRFLFEYPYKKTKISLQKKAKFFISPSNISVGKIDLAVAPKGMLRLEGQLSEQVLNLKGQMKNINLAYLPKDFKGIIDSSFAVSGTSSSPKGSMEILLKDFQTLSSPKMSFIIKGNIVESRGTHRASFSLNMADKEKYDVKECLVTLHVPLTYSPMLKVSRFLPVQGKVRYLGSLKTLWGYVPLEGRKLEGELDLSGSISGSLSRLELALEAKTANARYEDLLLGILLTDLNFETSLKKGHGTVAFSAKDGRKGTALINGSFDVPFLYHGKYVPKFIDERKDEDRKISQANREKLYKQAKRSLAVFDIETVLTDFNPFYRNDFTATLSGNLSITEMAENIRIDGDITVDKGEVHLENIRSSSIPKLNIVEDSSKRIRRKKVGSRGNLNIGVHILKNFGVYAPGIETLWKGDLQILGKVQDPAVKGVLSAWKGSMNILGTVLKLSKGDITFNGSAPIVPDLDLRLEHTGNGVTSYIVLTGMAYRPKLEMTSNPYLPSDEILAHILFSRSMKELSDFEKIRLATVLTSLAGFNINSGITATTKNLFGLDVLSLDSRQSASGEEEISVQLGKYLRNNVYVGLEQEVNSQDTAGVLQYEINENISVGAKAGTEDSAVGFKWRYDY